MTVIVDGSQVTDTSTELTVDVRVAGEGEELHPKDNFQSQRLQLVANAELKLSGCVTFNPSLKYSGIQRLGAETLLLLLLLLLLYFYHYHNFYYY